MSLETAGLHLQPMSFGGTTLGGRHVYSDVSETQAIDTVHTAYKAGMRYFDTAPFYGLGQSEERMGRALAALPRDDILLSSKVGRFLRPVIPPHGPNEAPYFPQFDYTYEAAFAQLDDSLARMNQDRLDIIYVHDVATDEDFETARDGACIALAEMKAAGRIAAYGAGLGSLAIARRFVTETDIDCIMLACRYTLMEQTALDDVYPLCAEHGVDVIAAAPFASGILATGAVENARYNYGVADEASLEMVRRMEVICDRYDVSLRAAALQFPGLHPVVKSVVTGSRSPAEVIENLALMERPIPPAFWAQLRDDRLIDQRSVIPA